MTTTISNFESQLINKIQFKASSKVSPDALLFKTFKFFDLYNNGYLIKGDFFRAIAKCGVVVQTINMDQIFNYYSTQQDGKIYYKEFIQILLFKDSQASLENKSRVIEQDNKSQPKINQSRKFEEIQIQIPNNKLDDKSRLKKSKIQQIYIHGETLDQIIDYIRKQIRSQGLTGLLSLANLLKSFDHQKTHTINGHKLKQCFQYLNNQQIKKIIEQYHPTAYGQINYAELIYSLKQNIQKQRLVLIQKTFTLLDTSKAKQIQIKKINDYYKGNNHLQFKKAIDLYCQFQGIDDGYFTDQDFSDFFDFISFGFISNQSFRDFMVKGFYNDQDTKSNKSNRSRPREFDRQSQYRNQNMNTSQINQKGDFRKNKIQQHEQNSQHSHHEERLSDFYDDKLQKKSVSRNSSKGNVSSSNIRQVESIVIRIKKRLATKGSKGFLLFQKALKNADLNQDGYITIDQFKKVIKQQRIDITNTQTNIIFDVFDTKKQGVVDFQELVYTVKGQTPENRKLLIERIWKRIKKNQQITTFSNIKQLINLRGHPDIQNGRRYQQDILKQLQQTILLIQDLNGTPRSQEISKDQFIQYLQNASLSVPQDQLFQCIAQTFWKIQSDLRIQDEYAGSRKLFDPKKKGYLMDHHRYAVKGGSVTDNAPFGTFSEPTVYLTEHHKL